eukprot:COSAG02_NODE_36694_length_451_cov_2.019886_1_plen_35_part_10
MSIHVRSAGGVTQGVAVGGAGMAVLAGAYGAVDGA